LYITVTDSGILIEVHIIEAFEIKLRKQGKFIKIEQTKQLLMNKGKIKIEGKINRTTNKNAN